MENLENIINNSKNVLIFTAHHDDESLFTGGLIDYLYNNNINIHLLVATNYKDENTKYDTDKKHKNFLSIIDKYKINYYELNVPNLQSNTQYKSISRIYNYSKCRLNILHQCKTYFKNNIFDIIFTHNINGEYGHPQHKLINSCVKYLQLNNYINVPIYTFGDINSKYYLKINLDKKYELLKTYSFKDTNEKLNIWYKQCIKNYPLWCSEEFEYFNIL